MTSQTELAVKLNISYTNLSKMISAGILTKMPRGEYDVEKATIEYIDHLRERAAGRGADLSEERARLAKEQADGKEMENEVSRGELVHIKDVGKNLERSLTKVRNRLLAIPTDISQEVMTCDTVAEAQEVIERAILGALNELVGADQAEASETVNGSFR